MITLEQRQILKNINEAVLREVLDCTNLRIEEKNVTMCSSKTGENTLKLHMDDKEIFFHSKYNPRREAETFATEYNDLTAYKHVLFVGTGLGYHINLILEANPHLKYSIFEPNSEILYHYLNSEVAPPLKTSKIVSIFSNIKQLKDLDAFSNHYVEGTVTVTWNVTKQVYSEQIEEFQSKFVEVIKNKRNQMAVNFNFQHHWTLNALANLPTVLNTPNIMLDVDREVFADKPIILVAAGPSLSYEWDNLKIIKDKGLAYIFAVGSAINGLLEKDILPDAFFTYDPSHLNKTVVAKLKEQQIDNVPVVFGSTVAPDTLIDLKTPLLHFVTSQDKLTPFALNDNLPIILDSPSISVMAYQVIASLKASHIIIVGQNLGYVENKVYADEIKYNHINETLTESQISTLIETEDVEGNKIGTTETFNSMRTALETVILASKHSTTINTTKKGANILGAPYKPLEEVVNEVLTIENIVKQEWYKCENQYDLQNAKSKIDFLNKESKKLETTLKTALTDIAKINELYNKKVLSNLDTHLARFDKSLVKLSENKFFNTLVIPTIQNQNVIFSKRSPEVKLEKNVVMKVKLFNDIFAKYIEAAYASYLIVQPKFIKVNLNDIQKKELE